MKWLSKLIQFSIVISLVMTTVLWTVPTYANQYYDHNDIMTDNIFNNSGSMGVSQIDTFLNSFSSSCISIKNGFTSPDPTSYTPTNGFTFGANVTAGQVIYDAAQAYGLNPQVLIATMQKEQSLITGTAGCYYNTPNPASATSCDLYGGSKAYNCTSACPYNGGCVNIALGYGCPGSCNAADEGFSEQVIHAAWMLKFSEQRSEGNLGWDVQLSNYPQPGDQWNNSDDPQSCYSNDMTTGSYQVCPGAPAAYYDGLYTIDGQAVHMDNGATAALYDFTPHFSGNQNFIDIFDGWFGATVETTPLLYSPGVVSPSSGQINVFARGLDFREWQTWFSSGSWQVNWNYIDNPSTVSSAPSVITWGNGHMDVFETRNGVLWHSWYNPSGNSGWQGWQPIGAPGGVWLGGTPTAVVQGPGQINVFVRGNDGRLWQMWYSNGNWQSWNYIQDPTPGASSASAISWQIGHMDVFETINGVLWHNWYNANTTGWQGWQPIGQPNGASLASSPGAVAQGPGQINVFARGNDGRLWQMWYSNGNWQSWNYIDNPSSNASSPTAISLGEGQMDVYDIRAGVLWHDWYSSSASGWQGWQPLGMP